MMAVSRLIALCLSIVLLVPPTDARTRKGDKLLKEGQEAEAEKDYDRALELFEQALATDFSDTSYLLFVRRTRFLAGQTHVLAGRKLRDQGKLQEALAEYQKAFAIDPSSTIAETEAKRTYQMIQRSQSKDAPPVAPEDSGKTAAEHAQREIEERMASIRGLPVLKPLNPQINNLKMTNQNARVLFETVGKLAGINVLFDPDFVTQSQGRNHSVDLTNSTIEDALDYVSLLTRAYWKPISANAIFVTQDQQVKRRDFEDNVAQIFYLRNATAAQEMNEIAAAIRAVTDIRRVLPYTSQMALMVRGTPDQVALAQKLIMDLDKPKPEVVVDVIGMEVNRTRTRSLAATITSGGVPGLNVPIIYTPDGQVPGNGDGDNGGGSTAPPGYATLAQLGSLSTNDFSIAMPGGIVQALLNDRTTRVLQNPQLRTLDTIKASLKIGQRYPYATGSFQPGIGTVGGVSPLVSTQFQFAEIGTNIDVQPKIHHDNDVTLHIEIELSTIADTINVGGLSQPVIGQRKVLEDVRLRDGEVAVLGGLSATDRARGSQGLPGLATLPGIGWLFGAQSSELRSAEVLIVMIPRIVRQPDLNETNLRTISVGSEQVVRLNYAPRTAVVPEAPAETKPQSAPGTPAPKIEPPQTNAPKPAAANQPQLLFAPAGLKTSVNAPVTLTLEARNVEDLFSAPFRIHYDPKLLKIVEIARGSLMSGDNQPVSFTRDVNTGTVRITRLPGASGVTGSGSLVTITLQPLAKGSAQVSIADSILQDSKLQPLNIPAAPVTITIE